jgi:hypothetical protein
MPTPIEDVAELRTEVESNEVSLYFRVDLAPQVLGALGAPARGSISGTVQAAPR